MQDTCYIKTVEGVELKGERTKSILDTSLLAGVNFQYSCRNGQCGICKATLLKGEARPIQPQIALTSTDIKKRKILTCCCAPMSNILIDAKDLTMLKGIEIQTLPARIDKIIKQTDQIIEVELRLPPTENFKFIEGQYITIISSKGIRRSYSIANCANESKLRLFIKKIDTGKLSQYWFNEAKENDLLHIEGPKGTFFLREKKSPIIFLATGTGIAPIKAILDRLSTQEKVSNLNLMLYWGNRFQRDFFWRPNYPKLNFTYKPILSRSTDGWHGEVGYIQNLVLNDNLRLANACVYACGSLLMIKSAKKILIDNGLNENHFYADAFVSS